MSAINTIIAQDRDVTNMFGMDVHKVAPEEIDPWKNGLRQHNLKNPASAALNAGSISKQSRES